MYRVTVTFSDGNGARMEAAPGEGPLEALAAAWKAFKADPSTKGKMDSVSDVRVTALGSGAGIKVVAKRKPRTPSKPAGK